MNGHSSIIHKSRNMENTQMPTNGWINKTWHTQAIEYYLATEKNEILMHSRAQSSLKNMLSERSQTWRPHAIGLHSCGISRTGKFIDTESSWVVARGWRETRIQRDRYWGWAVFLGWSKCSGIREVRRTALKILKSIKLCALHVWAEIHCTWIISQ